MKASIPSKSGVIAFTAILILIIFGSLSAGSAKFDIPVRFAVIGDHTGDAIDSVYEEIMGEVSRLRPDFVMTPGDCIEGYTSDEKENREEWKHFKEITKPFGKNFYIAPGNHDIWSDDAEKVYREINGDPYYSVDLKGIHFIMLDASRWDLESEMQPEQMKWLEEDLKANKDAACTMVFLHKPIWFETISKGKKGVLHDLFKKYGVDAVFTGHYHEYFSGEHDGIMYTGIGSSGGDFGDAASQLGFHYLWVTVDNDGIHVAPIRKESVADWKETTDDVKLAFEPVNLKGLSVEHPILVDKDLKAVPAKIKLVVDNQYTKFDQNDSIVWDIPENWIVEPASMPVNLKAGESANYIFGAECTGEIYPLPSAVTNLKFVEDRYAPARTDLSITRTAVCSQAGSAPTIDGQITEQCWKNPEDKYFNWDGKKMDADPFSIYFAYDKDNLYIAAFCAEMHMDSLVAKTDEQDGPVYGEDCVGFFFEPKQGTDSVYQIYFGASESVYDQKITLSNEGWQQYDRAWNGEYEVKVVKADKFWSLEARIPVAQFNTSMEKGKDWKLNFRRKQKHLDAASDWQVPIGAETEGMGVLKLE